MSVSSHRRRSASMSLALVSALVLAACSGDSDSDSSDDGDGSGNKDVAVGGKEFGTADKETAKLGSDAKPGAFPRTVKHAAGETTIKKKPKRIVVLDTGELDAVVSLGLKPVGMVTTEGANPTPSYLAGKVKGVKTVGTIQDVNLEAIAKLKPDLILGSELRVSKLYKQLSEIAPTVFSIRPGYPWKENFLLAGDSLGMEKKAVTTLNNYAKSAKKVKKQAKGDPTISLVRFMPGKIRLYGNKSLIGVVLHDAGLKRPKLQDVEDLAVEISPENIAKAKGDVIFYTSYGQPKATGESKVVGSSGWKSLTAVKKGKATRVNDDVWFLGLGPTGASRIVKDLNTFLVRK